MEIARAMEKNSYAKSTTPKGLLEVLKENATNPLSKSLKEYPEPNYELFPKIIDEEIEWIS